MVIRYDNKYMVNRFVSHALSYDIGRNLSAYVQLVNVGVLLNALTINLLYSDLISGSALAL